MHSMRRPWRGVGGGDLDLMSWGHCRFIRCIRFGRGTESNESNESNESKVAPRTFDSDTTTPMQVPLNLMNLMGSNASQVLAVGPTFDAFDSLAFGPGGDSDESTESKVLALGPTSDSLDSLDTFDALDAEAPEGLRGGTACPGSIGDS